MSARMSVALLVALLLTATSASPVVAATITFAVIGDYGGGGTAEASVAAQVNSWNPDFIITVGDNNYPNGLAATIDQNIGQFYHAYMYPYKGTYGSGAAINRFFPVLGNHDWGDSYPNPSGDQPYLNYFTLPNNNRYYDFVWGPIHFFALDSDPNEPDGAAYPSVQSAWLQAGLKSATEPWKLVYFHHTPYSSDTTHGPSAWMQWPFADWGASAVLSGHAHTYERLLENGIPYFVNGLGGEGIYDFNTVPETGSQVRYNLNYGAMKITASDTTITYQFITRDGSLRDSLKSTLPYTLAEAVRALRVAGGLYKPSRAEASRFEPVDTGEPVDGLDMSDAVVIARKAMGMDTNP